MESSYRVGRPLFSPLSLKTTNSQPRIVFFLTWMRALGSEEVRVIRAVTAVRWFHTRRTFRGGDVRGSGSDCWGGATTPVGLFCLPSNTVVHRGCVRTSGARRSRIVDTAVRSRCWGSVRRSGERRSRLADTGVGRRCRKATTTARPWRGVDVSTCARPGSVFCSKMARLIAPEAQAGSWRLAPACRRPPRRRIWRGVDQNSPHRRRGLSAAKR